MTRTADIAIVVPTLGRPQLLIPLMDSIRRHTELGRYGVVFVADEGDRETRDLVETALAGRDCRLLVHDGTFPQKVNVAVRETDEPYVLLCGDDVAFTADWLHIALNNRGVGVIGTNDLTPRTRDQDHATAQIVDREYINDPGAAWAEPGHVMHEGYHHNFADDELCRLAQYRGTWVFEPGCVIEHRHPCWGTAPNDDTYEKGAFTDFERDRRVFRKRRRLWMRSRS